MNKKFKHIESRGLPGGPNEQFTYITGVFSIDGYKSDSPDVNNPFNIIPSSNITMEGVDFPVRGYGNNGIVQDMKPGGNYNYGDADYVFEVPIAQQGGQRATISAYEEPAWYEKAVDYLASPMTALGYATRNQDLPDRLPISAENRNAFDGVIDTINPFAWAKYAASAKRNLDQGEYLDAGFDALGAIPIVPAWLSKGKNVAKNVPVDKLDDLVEVVTANGSIKKIPRKDAIRLNRVEDANVTNTSFSNYEDGNWFGDNLSEFYVNQTKSAMRPVDPKYDHITRYLYPEDPKRLITMYIDPSDAKNFNVAKGTATERALNMSGGMGNMPHPNEYVLPPALVKQIRETGKIPGASTFIGNSDQVMKKLSDFYKKYGGDISGLDKKQLGGLLKQLKPYAKKGFKYLDDFIKNTFKETSSSLHKNIKGLQKIDNSKGNNIEYVYKNIDGDEVAKFTGVKKGNAIDVTGINVSEPYRRQGIGQSIYEDVAKETPLTSRSSQQQFTLKDDAGRSISPSNKLWEKLVKEGKAEKIKQQYDWLYKTKFQEGGQAPFDKESWEYYREQNPEAVMNPPVNDSVVILPKDGSTKQEFIENLAKPKPEFQKPKTLNFNNILDYVVETRGGDRDLWGKAADTIAFHESGPWARMDVGAKQYLGGPGRGLFQFEGPSLKTAQKRYTNIAKSKGFTPNPDILNAKSADQLNAQDQYTLFFANLIESKAKLSDYAKGKMKLEDLWLTGHKNVEKQGDRESFLESLKAAEKEGIKNGYTTFKKGGEFTLYDIYKKYVMGGATDEVSKDIYDKLNRVHYKDAKGVGMSVPNYILTYVMKGS